MILIVGIVGCSFGLISESSKQKEYGEDFAEIQNIKYGLLNVTKWKEKIADIVVKKVEGFKLTTGNKDFLRVNIESILNSYLDTLLVELRGDVNSETDLLPWIGAGLKSFAAEAAVASAAVAPPPLLCQRETHPESEQGTDGEREQPSGGRSATPARPPTATRTPPADRSAGRTHARAVRVAPRRVRKYPKDQIFGAQLPTAHRCHGDMLLLLLLLLVCYRYCCCCCRVRQQTRLSHLLLHLRLRARAGASDASTAEPQLCDDRANERPSVRLVPPLAVPMRRLGTPNRTTKCLPVFALEIPGILALP